MLLQKSKIYQDIFRFGAMTFLELQAGTLDIYTRPKNAIFYECCGRISMISQNIIAKAFKRIDSDIAYRHVRYRKVPKMMKFFQKVWD